MGLLEKLRAGEEEFYQRLEKALRELPDAAARDRWMVDEDSPLMLAEDVFGAELADGEEEQVFRLLDELCRRAGLNFIE